MTHSFKDIVAWQKAHAFVILAYQTTATFPPRETYGLPSQLERAAVSIAANIAEGYRRISKADKLRLLNIAQSSLEECQYYILLAKDLQYIDSQQYIALSEAINCASYFLNAYSKGIKEKTFSSEI
ncbi:MAG: four helix bundle protein [Bacteroidaceae bacterium]|nr:four helix bundle protein [Bacteroidaceae bacterium]